MEILVLNDFDIGQYDLQAIKNCDNLRYLEISGSAKFFNAANAVSSRCKLEHLSLSHVEIEELWVNDFVLHNPGLRHLQLHCNSIYFIFNMIKHIPVLIIEFHP